MPWVEFEPTIPVFERAKTVHASDRAAIVTGDTFNYDPKYHEQHPQTLLNHSYELQMPRFLSQSYSEYY
jgi:hypothetical protein